jgi:hypothetical protein
MDEHQHEEVHLKVSSRSDSSTDDPNRKELLWEKREEAILEEWRQRMLNNSTAHGKKGRVMKTRYVVCTVPAIIIPVVASGLSNVMQPYPLATAGTMLTTSILAGINGFFNFGSKTERHFQFEAAYMVLANEVQKEMCKPKAMRPPCDVYLQKIMSKMNELDASAPVV